MKPIASAAVAKVFEAYPSRIKTRLLVLRALIFETAAAIPSVGVLEEALKWGEPAYLTTQSKTGSTIRIGWKKSAPDQYAIYFNCQTSLVETFRTLFPCELKFEGNRAIVFDESCEVPVDILHFCIGTALTYHQEKKHATG